jgi:ABC-type glycerol-3-phosphate transport system substrate-binding protein
MTPLSDNDATVSRRGALAAGAGAAASLFSGCAGVSGLSLEVRQFDESDPLVTYDRAGRGSTELSYWTSRFYMPAESGNNQPELSPLTGPFYRTLKQQSSQPAATPALRAQHEEWARTHPDYRIELSYPDSGEWKQQLSTHPPDGSTVNNPWVPDLYDQLQPLDEYVSDVEDFFPFVRETAVYDGSLLAAWKYTDCRCLYYREDLIDAYAGGDPPRTWEELVDVGSAITEGEGIDGFQFRPAMSTTVPFIWGQGGQLIDQDGDVVLSASKNRLAVRRTLSFLRRLVEEGASPERTVDITEYETLARNAREDEVAMFVGGSWQIEKDFKNRTQGDRWRRWKVAEIPMRRPGQYSTAVGGFAEGTFREGDSGGAAALKEFVAKFVEPASMGRYCEAAGQLPTRRSVFDDEDLYSPNAFPYQEQFRRFLEHGRAPRPFPVYSDISDAFEAAIRAVVLGQSTPQEATNTMIRQFEE